MSDKNILKELNNIKTDLSKDILRLESVLAEIDNPKMKKILVHLQKLIVGLTREVSQLEEQSNER
jgi:hypothetical protein